MPKPCPHCRLKNCCHGRNLCDDCRKLPEVRSQYPSASKFARRGHGVGKVAVSAAVPTLIGPGPRKVAVMQDRASRCEELFHADDEIVFEDYQRAG